MVNQFFHYENLKKFTKKLILQKVGEILLKIGE